MECGKVLFFSAGRGYGRIERRCGGTVFFGVQDLAETGAHFGVGDKVEFELTTDSSGRSKAIMVRHVT
jgi:cold shock CspA family protein